MRPLALLTVLLVAATGCKDKEPAPRLKIKKIERIQPPPPPRPRRRYPEQVRHDPNAVLGGEQGLDHLGVAVKDLDGAGRVYIEKLGFGHPQRGRLENGLQNINFYFGDTTYLELLNAYDAKKNPWVAGFVERHEQGALFAMLCVFSYGHTANFLRRRGFKVSDPQPGRIRTRGLRMRSPGRGKAPSWLTFSLEGQTLPGNTSFIAYTRRLRSFMLTKLKDPELRRKLFSHPNTALGLRSAWIAVPQLARARKAFEAIGLQAGKPVEIGRLKARGVPIQAGKGTLLLLEPRKPKQGPLARFLARRGQGIIGLGIEVERLETATKYIQQHAGLALAPYDRLEGRAVLVPPELARGVWLELFERGRGVRL